MKITVNKIMSLSPCARYTRERVMELWAGRKSITPEELLALPISAEDRIWAACRVFPKQVIKRWLDTIVTRAIKQHALRCGIPSVETWAKKWLSGKDRTEKSAGAAAEAAAEEAARSAVWAARAAAWAAADAADAAVSADAAWRAAVLAEREQQIKDLRDALKAEKKERE